MATPAEINAFLAQAERKAYKHALYTTRDDEVALDIVQDSMMKLVENYSEKPANELPMLFTRIVQNTTFDYFRKQKVRDTWTTLLSKLTGNNPDRDEFDILESIEVEQGSKLAQSPQDALEQDQVMALIEAAIGELPPRQREAFLLRYWEDCDTAETAKLMGCSEGSVKTHCSRAVQALATVMKRKGMKL
jgi:RNA polymerase sigma-70 factor, ECF subfamily